MLNRIEHLVHEMGLKTTPELAREILPLIDLTSLNDNDTSATIKTLCQKAVVPQGHVAAVCVYPQFVGQAKNFLKDSPVNIATVANFPKGTASADEVIPAIQQSIAQGADEIDVVFPYERYLDGDKAGAEEFIRLCKSACGTKILKVILETSFYQNHQTIAEVAESAVLSGADFLKTSTGKRGIGATPEAAIILLSTIKDMQARIARPLGFKAAGGLRTLTEAGTYLALAKQIMGASWVKPATFRLGASQLMDVLISKSI